MNVMRESWTYQSIIEEGRLAQARETLLRLGTKRFGAPDALVRQEIEAITIIEQQEQLTEQVLEVENWDQLPVQEIVRRQRLVVVMQEQLRNPDSDLVQWISEVLQGQEGLEQLSPYDIIWYFQNHPASQLTSQSVAPAVLPSQTAPSARRKRISVRPAPSINKQSLEEWLRTVRQEGPQIVLGTKPESISFPDGRQVQVLLQQWAELDQEVVRWLGERGKLPALPFRVARGGCYFLNDEPCHANPGNLMRTFREVRLGGRRIFINTTLSADQHIRHLHALCRACGMPPSGFILQLRSL